MAKKGSGKKVFCRIAMVTAACMLLGPFQYAGFSAALAVVLVAGVAMDPMEGAASAAAYLLGGLWLAVYPGGGSGATVLLGARGGFLLAMPFCILVISACIRGWNKKPLLGAVVGLFGAFAVYFGGGILWYTVKTGTPLLQVLKAEWGGACLLFFLCGGFAVLAAGNFRRVLR